MSTEQIATVPREPTRQCGLPMRSDMAARSDVGKLRAIAREKYREKWKMNK
jgi:hypothetical protein